MIGGLRYFGLDLLEGCASTNGGEDGGDGDDGIVGSTNNGALS